MAPSCRPCATPGSFPDGCQGRMGHPTAPLLAHPYGLSSECPHTTERGCHPHIPLSVAAVPGVGRLSPLLKRVAPVPSVPSWCCRMPSRHCVISRNEGREVGSICEQEGFPVRSAPPLPSTLPSKGSSQPLPLCRQSCLSCLAALGAEMGGSHCSNGKRVGGRLLGSQFPPWCGKW